VTGGDVAERTADILEKIGRVAEDRLAHAALRLELLDQQHRLTVEVYAVVKLSPSDVEVVYLPISDAEIAARDEAALRHEQRGAVEVKPKVRRVDGLTARLNCHWLLPFDLGRAAQGTPLSAGCAQHGAEEFLRSESLRARLPCVRSQDRSGAASGRRRCRTERRGASLAQCRLPRSPCGFGRGSRSPCRRASFVQGGCGTARGATPSGSGTPRP